MLPAKLTIFLCTVALLNGCANVKVSPVLDGDDQKGVRYWEPLPYLLVSQPIAKDGAALGEAKNIQIIYLPNICKQRKIEVSAGFGSVEMNPQLTNGWMLTGFEAKADSKVSETIGAIASLMPTIIGLRPDPDSQKTEPQPGLYPLLFANGILVGFGERIEFGKKSESVGETSCEKDKNTEQGN